MLRRRPTQSRILRIIVLSHGLCADGCSWKGTAARTPGSGTGCRTPPRCSRRIRTPGDRTDEKATVSKDAKKPNDWNGKQERYA